MKTLITYSLLVVTTLAFSQEKVKPKKDPNLIEGNKQFEAKDYVEAEANYRISQSNEPTKATSSYNLGNTIYRQKQSAEAAIAYYRAVQNAKTKQQKHMAYHNLGNALMDVKDYQSAVEMYKNALRNNPADEETRYNFALAKKMLKDNPPPPPPPPKKDDKKDDKNKNDQKDNKNQAPKDKGDNKDKGGEGNKKQPQPSDDQEQGKGDKGDDKSKTDKPQQGANESNGSPKPSGASPSKQRMQNMLDAMNNEEKKVQDKVNAKKGKAPAQQNEKDW